MENRIEKFFEEYPPMSFLKTEADFKKYLHYLTDTSNQNKELAKDQYADVLMFVISFFCALGEELGLSKKRIDLIWDDAITRWENIKKLSDK